MTALEALRPFGLRLTFADGATLSVDLAPTIRTHCALGALADPALFATARLDSLGGYVVWIADDLEMVADNLRNLAVEQAGGIGHVRLANGMAEHGLTQERAADAIGISRRMLTYYLAGSRPIPKTVRPACLGWAAEGKERLVAAQPGGRCRRAAAARKAAWAAAIPHTFGRTFNSGWGEVSVSCP